MWNNDSFVYLDGLFYKGAGIGRYYESLLKGLTKKDIRIYTCVPLELRDFFVSDFKQYSKNIIPIYVNYKGFSTKAFFEQGQILKNIEKEVSLFHFPHINIPSYVPKNLIVTIHDLRPFTEFWDRSYFKKRIYKFYFKKAIKSAKKVISISETTKREILLQYFIDSSKISVIHEFVDEKFFYNNILEKKNDKNIIGDYVLFVGSRKKHKNLSRLIYAFNFIKDRFPDLKLVIAGKKDSEEDDVSILIKKLNMKDRLIEIISPNDDKILCLYKYAKTFIFPSLYEGFGLPPLEAMSYGIPIIASNIPVLKETCGNAAYFVDPYSSESIAQGIYKVLCDSNLKKSLIEKGKKRINDFNSNKLINRYIKVYKETLNVKN